MTDEEEAQAVLKQVDRRRRKMIRDVTSVISLLESLAQHPDPNYRKLFDPDRLIRMRMTLTLLSDEMLGWITIQIGLGVPQSLIERDMIRYAQVRANPPPLPPHPLRPCSRGGRKDA